MTQQWFGVARYAAAALELTSGYPLLDHKTQQQLDEQIAAMTYVFEQTKAAEAVISGISLHTLLLADASLAQAVAIAASRPDAPELEAFDRMQRTQLLSVLQHMAIHAMRTVVLNVCGS